MAASVLEEVLAADCDADSEADSDAVCVDVLSVSETMMSRS